MNRRPIIVCASAELLEGGVKRLFVNKAYADAIQEAGGMLVTVAGNLDEAAYAEIIETADGLLLPGGGDVNPERYGQKLRKCRCGAYDQRDAEEFALLNGAMKRRLPILAICRGMQIVNVNQGGTLYQDLESEMNGAIRHKPEDKQRSAICHEVAISSDTRLQKILGVAEIGVNSLHHQGVAEVGKGLMVTATAPDGLVEAIELKDYPFLIGVQWHPEELTDPIWKKLFSDFVSEAAK